METKTGAQPGDDEAPASQESEYPHDGSASAESAGASSGTHAEATLASLSARLASQQARVEQIERSLVERIGDVDDDRRRTAVQLQRARQGQEEEVAARLRQQSRLQLWVMAGFALVVAIVLALFYWQLGTQARPLVAEIDALRQAQTQQLGTADAIDRLEARLTALASRIDAIALRQSEFEDRAVPTGMSEVDARLQARIEVLGETIGEVSRSLAGIEEQLAVQLAQLTEGLQGLDADQQRLANSLARLPEASSPGEDATPSPAGPTAAGASEQAPRTREPGAGAAPAEPSQRATPDGRRASPGIADAAAGPATAEGEGARRQIDDPSYAVQLIGYFDLDRLRAFATREDLPAPVYYREETYRGRPWYVLIHSVHPSYARAAASLAELPPPLSELDPIIRRLPAGSAVRQID